MNSKKSYKTILKSTSLIGGSQVVRIVFRIIRSKILALLIGPSGIGLIGAYNSAIQLFQRISGLGIGSSAVRDVAKASQTNDQQQISETVYALRKIVLLTGISGTILTFLLSKLLSEFTFGNDQYSLEIKILSIIIFLNIVREGQAALIQGMRRIKDLSKLTVWGAVWGTVVSIPLIYLFGEEGIVPFLIIVASVQLVVSWKYAGKISISKVKLTAREVLLRSKGMIKLGIAFMGGTVATAAAIYFIRVIIIRQMDIEAAGFYQAAMALSTIYIGFILDAMGKDFYPRLAALANDNSKTIQVINEQIEVGILIATPGLLFTLALAPFIIRLFYSSEFTISYQILRWMILGIFLRVISFPMGYFFIARGKGTVFFLTQLGFNTMHVMLIFFLVSYMGIIGSGVAFFVLYVLHVVIIRLLISREIEFKWSKRLKRDMILVLATLGVCFVVLLLTQRTWATIVVSFMAMLSVLFASKRILGILELSSYKELWLVLKKRL